MNEDMRFLSLNPRGRWVFKITLASRDPKREGVRITQQLRTADPVEARIRRDLLLEFLIRAENRLRMAKM